MFAPPLDLDDRSLRDLLLSSWHFDRSVLIYEPVGFGSHHWRAVSADGDARFVTVDDLDAKRLRGTDTADDVFDRSRTFTAVRPALAVHLD